MKPHTLVVIYNDGKEIKIPIKNNQNPDDAFSDYCTKYGWNKSSWMIKHKYLEYDY